MVRVLLLVSAFALASLVHLEPAEACWNVRHPRLKAKSKSRRVIARTIKKKQWKKARDLLIAERARAVEKQNTNRWTKRLPPERRASARSRIHFEWKGEAWAAYQLGLAHHMLGDNQAARGALTSFLGADTREAARQQELGPDHALLLSKVQFDLGKLDDAAKTLIAEMKVRPRDARLHSQLGSVHEGAGFLEAAATSLKKAIELDKNSHGGMEWVHLEVVRFRIQLRDAPKSAATRPFEARVAHLRGAKRERALTFAQSLAPELPIRSP